MTISRVIWSIFSDLTCEIATPFATPQESLPVGYIFNFSQLLEICVLHWEYCSALALGQDVYQNSVYTAIDVRIRAVDCTLVGKHMCSRDGVLGSNPTTPNFVPHVFAARRRLLRNAPSKGHHSRYITLFFEGTYSVIGIFELMRMFLVSLMHFLR